MGAAESLYSASKALCQVSRRDDILLEEASLAGRACAVNIIHGCRAM